MSKPQQTWSVLISPKQLRSKYWTQHIFLRKKIKTQYETKIPKNHLRLIPNLSKTPGNNGTKLISRNNIIRKIEETNWGAQICTLLIAAQALVYSVSEYCALVWESNSHTDKIDVQLLNTTENNIGHLEIYSSTVDSFLIKYYSF